MLATLKRMIKWLGTFPQSFSENSTKLLALLISALTGGFLVAVVIPFILIYDVLRNGYVMTDLSDLGIFLCCIGAYIFGSGVNVKVPEFRKKKKHEEMSDEEEIG